MKRLITCIVIFLGIIGICTWGTLSLRHHSHSLTQTLQAAHDAASEDRMEEALRLTEDFLSDWEEAEQLFIYILRHEQMDEVTFSSARLLPFLRQGDSAEFCAEVSEIIRALEHLWETEKPSLENFF